MIHLETIRSGQIIVRNTINSPLPCIILQMVLKFRLLSASQGLIQPFPTCTTITNLRIIGDFLTHIFIFLPPYMLLIEQFFNQFVTILKCMEIV